MIRRIAGAATLAGLCWMLCAAASDACDNPVWEYSMLHWQLHAHHVYYLHDGSEKPGDAAANEFLRRAATSDESHTNVLFRSLNVRDIGADAPEEYRVLVKRHAETKLPAYVVLTPRWAEYHAGPLSLADAKVLLDSPKRREMTGLLSEGKNGLLVLLSGDDEAETARARDQVREALQAGKEYDWDVAFVEIDRADAKEKWLVRQMLTAERGLAQVREPMLFGAFGKGHIEGPHVGQMIKVPYILDLMAFMNGPCSCMLDPLASGADILTTWDWETPLLKWVPVAERDIEPGGFVTF